MATIATTLLAAEYGERDASVKQQYTSEDHKNERPKTALFLREAEKNKRQIEKLEKEKMLFVLCRKNGWSDVSGELEEYEKTLEKETNAEKVNLRKHLMKIQNDVRNFQKQLTDVKPTPELIEKLKEIMSEVENSVNTLKEGQRSSYEELLKEERIYRLEITAYEKKIENWNLAVKADHKLPTAPTGKAKFLERDLPAEVKALEAFLERSEGPYGGWDECDHHAFLKFWTKHRGKPVYRKEAKLFLPAKTLEEIEQHEKWQLELIHLKEEKREAIQRWKSSKHQERKRTQSQKEEEEAVRGEEMAQSQFHLQRMEKRKTETAQRLKEWREDKKRKEEEEKGQRLAKEVKKRRQEKAERCCQLELKLTLEEHLQLRRKEELEEERRKNEEHEREMEKRRNEAAKGIKRWSERDLHKVETKLKEKQFKEKQEEERRMRIATKLKEKVSSHIIKDPSRITCLTKQWEERMKDIEPSEIPPVMQMFHRAVPTWRQGL